MRSLTNAALASYGREVAEELVKRGWFVTAFEPVVNTERSAGSLIVGVNFMPQRRPSWLKAFELPISAATPDLFEKAIEVWKRRVRHDLRHGRASHTVRRMLAEHGPEAVREAMRERIPSQ